MLAGTGDLKIWVTALAEVGKLQQRDFFWVASRFDLAWSLVSAAFGDWTGKEGRGPRSDLILSSRADARF